MRVSWLKAVTKLVPNYLYSNSQLNVRMSTMSNVWDKSEEIKIQLPIGTIAGKWWGPKHVRPIICLHGWQDNAGSFDAIIPLLPKHVSYLALDLPGHGFSYRYPTGVVYNFTDSMFLIKLIVEMYKWKKVSLFSHSMSILTSYMYAGLLPDEVDFIISIDMLKPPYFDANYLFDRYKSELNSYAKLEKQSMTDTKPQTYSYDDAVKRLVNGSRGSITKEAAPYLLKRGIAPSKSDATKYYFTYDNRVKLAVHKMMHNNLVLMLAEKMRLPYLCIKANSETPFYLEPIPTHDEGLEVLKKSNPNFEYHVVEGSHHVHLTEPEKVCGILSDFICRSRPINSEIEDVNKNNYVNCKL